MKDYFYANGVSLSILLNTLSGGEPYQNFSARNWNWKRSGKLNLVLLIDLIHMDEEHCMNCWVNWIIARTAVNDRKGELDDGRPESDIDRLRRGTA